MIGLGIIAAALFTRPRAVDRGLHPDTSIEILLWTIPAGIVGARIYHIITDWVPIQNWHKIWEGGLGIPGGILLGTLGGLLFMHRRGLTRSKVLDALIPGVPLAQAIGRWGNWWNQELFGRATDVPWALEIDVTSTDVNGNLVSSVETFHPTFLYESLWNLGLVALLVIVDRRRILKPGRLIWLYVAGYAVGRLWIEALRIDKATEVFGVRVNIWTMGFLLILSLFMLSRSVRSSADREIEATAVAGADGGPEDDEHAEDDAATDRATSSQKGESSEEE